MGLDMFLKRTKRVEGVSIDQLREIECLVSEHSPHKPFTMAEIEAIPFGIEFADVIALRGEHFKYYTIYEEVGYWRKANQVHNWFVNNVQKGVDDCNTYIVSKEKLEELLKTVNMVLKDSSLTHLLPTKSGFFFGSTLYDEWYFQDLKNTKKILKKVLIETDFEKQLVVYRASW